METLIFFLRGILNVDPTAASVTAGSLDDDEVRMEARSWFGFFKVLDMIADALGDDKRES